MYILKPPVNSGVGLGCPDFTILNWRCTGSGKWGSLQNHNIYPFHHYKIMTPTPTRSLESCKIRAPKILLGGHFSKKWPLQNQSPDPAHWMCFCWTQVPGGYAHETTPFYADKKIGKFHQTTPFYADKNFGKFLETTPFYADKNWDKFHETTPFYSGPHVLWTSKAVCVFFSKANSCHNRQRHATMEPRVLTTGCYFIGIHWASMQGNWVPLRFFFGLDPGAAIL